MNPARDFDVIVIGGGHAGAEAALAAARLGAKTACVVLDPAAIGRMSCNPAIGGIAKGQLVREIDALGGEMALATDAAGIQFRMLNTRKGPAVRSPRAQCDRARYNEEMARRVGECPGLTVVEGEATELVAQGRRVSGVRLADGSIIEAPATVLTTGTFLGGILFAGDWQEGGGRFGERPAARISESLRRLGLRLGRHKTGTPPRLRGATIDFDALEIQPGDDPPRPFSFRTEALELDQLPCWLTRTTPRTHEIIAANAHLSPMSRGRIQGVGPRYCPRVEDKVLRFPGRDHHLVFLEPEGRESDEIYPNGVSTSLPFDVQREFLRTIPGLEQVEFVRPGYAVEYDYLITDQIRADLSVASVDGLYAAGQINGTSGYEEAAAQGLVAGINAAHRALDREPLLLDRSSSYIGVMIDDLCRVNPREPYRMFTSRAEFRLLLRSDNADRRLVPIGRELGLVDAERASAVRDKERRIHSAIAALAAEWRDGKTLEATLRRPAVRIDDLRDEPCLAELGLRPDELAEVEAEVKYAGYVTRQAGQVELLKRMEGRLIPREFDFSAVEGLSTESKGVLGKRRPLTVGEASRLAGVTPCDLNLLLTRLTSRAADESDGRGFRLG